MTLSLRPFIFCRVFVLSLSLICVGAADQGWINALKPQPAGDEDLVLSKFQTHPDQISSPKPNKDKLQWILSNYDIVIPATPTTQEIKAAAELSRWLEDMTGTPFVVIQDSQPKARHEISIGGTNRFGKATLEAKHADLKDEGYAIAVSNGDLFLWGGLKRGPIYAVFALLEEDLGCRWYPNGVTVIPKMPELTFRPAPRVFIPKLEGREPFYFSSLNQVWSLRNRTNSAQVAIRPEWGGYEFWPLRTHSFARLVPPEQYFADHPNYYGSSGSKRIPQRLCLTNPDIIPIICDNLRKILRESPGARAVMISKEDGGWSECSCARCVAFNKAHGYEKNILGKAVPGGGAATHLAMVNTVAERLESEFPGVLFCTYAYTYTMLPPTGLKARSNVGIRLCNNIMKPEPFTSITESDEYQKIFKGWEKVTKNLFIYDYWGYKYQWSPTPNMEMIVANIRWWMNQEVLEISGLGTATWTKHGDRDAMRAWVLAKLLWNPEWDLKQLQRDFYHGYFGKAGPAMLAYDELIQASFDQHRTEPGVLRPADGRNYSLDIAFLSEDFQKKALELLAQARAMAETETAREDIEQTRDAMLRIPKTIQKDKENMAKKGDDGR